MVVAAQRMATPAIRRQFTDLMAADGLDDADIARWRSLIVATGAPSSIETGFSAAMPRQRNDMAIR